MNKLFDELNAARAKVGLNQLDLDDMGARVFNSKATSYAFHLTLSKEMIPLVGSLATGFDMSLSGNVQAMKTIEACINRGLIYNKKDGGYALTRVGCLVALMLEAGKFLKLDATDIKRLKSRI